MRGTLIHTLDAEHMWRYLCRDHVIVSPTLAGTEPFPTLESIASYWKQEEHEMWA